MSSKVHFDASSEVRLRSSLSSIPDVITATPFNHNVHHRGFLTEAAYGGLKPPPTRRLRRVYLHLSHSMTLSCLLDTRLSLNLYGMERPELGFGVRHPTSVPLPLASCSFCHPANRFKREVQRKAFPFSHLRTNALGWRSRLERECQCARFGQARAAGAEACGLA
jgi:hypothetical protein